MNDILQMIGNGLVIYTFVASLGFVIAYHLMARWWESSFGKSLMIYQAAMTAILGLSVLRFVSDTDSVAWAVIRLVVFAGVPFALTWRLAVLIRTQMKTKTRRKLDHDD